MKFRLCIFILLSFLCACHNAEPQPSDEAVLTVVSKQGDHYLKQSAGPDGKLKWETQMVALENGKMIVNGYMKEFFKNGNVKKLSFFKKGIQDSICIAYFENGAKQVLYWYADGREVGARIYYDSLGNRRKNEQY
ncbi:toxin-antitoxin system YwqK family antitoxin [Taibaiella soli]|uniref:Toxin-antitoxin system YwqK family antitoxin n=1 Tax=Taibaiella soli TaxID=1649169 RepID=A0A2W2B469_9BACT|nr:hypothetical protein [Taibaiella soli]PZF74838.1 hypothetical protein DN068_01175 [Taibaiella soli]